jgi:hypothetical protein
VTKSTLAIFASPVLCLALLGGIVAEDRTHLKPGDVESYHRHAKEVLEAWPKQLADGQWVTEDDRTLPPAAEQLLHPNVEIDRLYVNRDLWINGRPAAASLLIVQCKDSRDMLGHYPPVCYPAHGMTKVSEQQRDWAVGDTTIPGTEYVFLHDDGQSKYRTAVYNFMIVPGLGIVRDMNGIAKAAADYQRRYFGAAQFQVTMDADTPQYDRDRVFAALVGGNLEMIETLKSGGTR